MKRTFYILLFGLITTSAFSQIVNIPDPGFKQYLVEEGIDTNGDGEIQVVEAEVIETLLIVSGNSIIINSLEGIKSFINLKNLSLDNININTVDISGMGLTRLDISTSAITSLVASNCSQLTDVHIVDPEQIHTVDFSECTALVNIDGTVCAEVVKLNNCTALEELSFFNCDISILELSGCIGLRHFQAQEVSPDFSFDFSDVPSLESFILYSFGVDSIIIHNHLNLRHLEIESASKVSIRECPELNTFLFGGIFRLDLFRLPNLSNMNFGFSYFDSVRIEECHALQFSEITNSINDLTIHNCNAIDSLRLSGHYSRITINNCNSLESIEYASNIDSHLWDFSGLGALKSITSLSHGPIELILDGCYNLESITIASLWAEMLDFSECINLKNLNLGFCVRLKNLILKNGSMEAFELDNASFLDIVCVDTFEQAEMQSYLSSVLDHEVIITTSCEFSNGGRPFSITGTSFLDINSDSCKTSDVTLPFSKYKISSSIFEERFIFSNEEGLFNYNVPEGEYTFGPDLLFGDYIFTSAPENQTVTFPMDGTEIVQNFCFIPNPAEVDVIEVHLIPLVAARPGFDTHYLITYTNTGNVTRGGDIKFTFPEELMDFVSSEPMLDVQEDGFLSWSFEDLIPYETRNIEFTMNLNSPMDTPPLNGGDILSLKAEVGPLGNQTLTVYWSCLDQEIVNSFDPNDKTCLNGNAFDQELIGDYLKYMIRFENTGTAEAVNIVITDTLDDAKLDVRTLQVINASHEVETELTDNVIKFIFKDIYLPFDDATNDGYVTFKIKTLPSLVLGDDIRNKAEIYFDFNFPIVTNTTSTVISDFISVSDIANESIDIEISPNPASELFSVRSEVPMNAIEIWDMSGRLVEKVAFVSTKIYHTHSADHLGSGVYMIKIRFKDDFISRKIVIE